MTFLTDQIIKGTDWRALERATARLMSHAGWKSVRVIGRSGDAGADVIGYRDGDGLRKVFVVQAKAITGGGYIGPQAIEQVLLALSSYQGDIGVVATNGDFTRGATKRRAELISQGFDIRLWNGAFMRMLIQKCPEQHPQFLGTEELRPYQKEIADTCEGIFDEGGTRAQIVVATGLGKTVIASELVRRLQRKGLSRVLVLCHARDLALQLEESFWRQMSKEIPTRVFFEGAPPKPYDGINFGLYQTFSGYLSGTYPGDYDLVIVDEAHHAIAYGFRKCIQHLKPGFLLGMTATPWRGDGVTLDGLFGSPVARVSLVDGMKMGYLAPVDYRIYCDTIAWEKLRGVSGEDISIKDLNKRLFIPQRDEAVIDQLVSLSKTIEPKAIIFCASIEHCNRFSNLLNANSKLRCKTLSGVDRVERNKRLMEFASGRLSAVTAVDVLNEGIDVPDVNTLVFLRSTHSRRIFVQQLGRGLRISPFKKKLVVLDFVTDIRRIAEMIEMDREARRPDLKYKTVYFQDGIVTFNNQDAVPFVDEWISDVADLGDTDESQRLKFPEL